MCKKIILASKSKVRKSILDKNNIESIVEPSNVDENIVKISLLNEKASQGVEPLIQSTDWPKENMSCQGKWQTKV